MAFYVRSSLPPRLSRYQDYKPYLRADFRRQCAYCEISEGYRRGAEVFGVDHFRPQKRFPQLELEYPNLYYCCNQCNSYKGTAWPSAEQEAAGLGFADPCRCDPYLEHFEEQPDGRLSARTAVGAYTLRWLRLDREECRRFRQARARISQRIAALRAMAQGANEDVRPILLETLAELDRDYQEAFGVNEVYSAQK